ncbi:hypothetical protein ES703_70301 [subsurface metagenome]
MEASAKAYPILKEASEKAFEKDLQTIKFFTFFSNGKHVYSEKSAYASSTTTIPGKLWQILRIVLLSYDFPLGSFGEFIKSNFPFWL